MKRAFKLSCLLCLQSLVAQASAALNDEWDIVRTYQAATHVFYGEVSKILPEPDFKTGVIGVRVRDIDDKDPLPLEAIVWDNAKEFTFSVEAQFKETMPVNFVAYLASPNLEIWTHVQNEAGDVFLAKPEMPDSALLHLKAGVRGLFYVRYYLGSNLPVLYKVRLGMEAEEDFALLQAYRASSNVTLESIVRQVSANMEAAAKEEALTVRTFEDEYYKILRIRELEIRRSMLIDLTERMGYSGLWDYFDFKQRYLQAHGMDIEDSEIPRGPSEGREKLWHDISGELKKIEVVLKARTQ